MWWSRCWGSRGSMEVHTGRDSDSAFHFHLLGSGPTLPGGTSHILVTSAFWRTSKASSLPVITSWRWGCDEESTAKGTCEGKLLSTPQIDDKQLRGYLSELRPVTIVFVNLMFKDQDKAEVIGSAIQDACVHINSVLRVFRGQINKVFMFDKVNMN